MTARQITSTDQIDDALADTIAEVCTGFYGDGPIDWDSALDRIEKWGDVELPSDLTDPVIRKVMRIGRDAKRESS